MNTAIWGGFGWDVFNGCVRNAYLFCKKPGNGSMRDQTTFVKDMLAAMESFGHVLPCGACRKSFGEFLPEAVAIAEEAVGHSSINHNWYAFLFLGVLVWTLHHMVNEKRKNHGQENVKPDPALSDYLKDMTAGKEEEKEEKEKMALNTCGAMWILVMCYALSYDHDEFDEKKHLFDQFCSHVDLLTLDQAWPYGSRLMKECLEEYVVNNVSAWQSGKSAVFKACSDACFHWCKATNWKWEPEWIDKNSMCQSYVKALCQFFAIKAVKCKPGGCH